MKRAAIAVGAIVAGTASGQFVDDFESYAVGGSPGGVWVDASTRIDAPTVPAPSATIIETTDAFGNATRALQTVDAIGTSSGSLAQIDASLGGTMSMNLRIDQFTDVTRGATWSAAVGFLQDTGVADFNTGPQAVVYAGVGTPTFRVFVNNNGRFTDFAISGALVELDTWFNIELSIDSELGTVGARVVDIATGDVTGETTRAIAGWSSADARYDALAFFDGEYQTVGGTQGGLATIDGVSFVAIPTPGAFAVLALGVSVAVRRRRLSSPR